MNVTKSFIFSHVSGGANTKSVGPMTADTVAEQARTLSEWDFVGIFNSQVSSRQTAICERYGLPQDASAYDVYEAARK
jgi:hypothetical protein